MPPRQRRGAFVGVAAALWLLVLPGPSALGAAALPGLASDNAGLRAQNRSLEQENERLHELLAAYQQDVALRPRCSSY